MKLPEIIGIAGTNGSGKDTLGAIRQRLGGAITVSLSDILRHELNKKGISHERENLRSLSAEWRAQEGPGVLSVKTIEQYNQEKEARGLKGLSIVSLRHPAEAEVIKQAGGIVVWVDADVRIRYDRILRRNEGRAEDQKTFDEFVREEMAEMSPEGNNEGLNMSGVRDIADIKITNDFSRIEEFEAYLIDQFELA